MSEPIPVSEKSSVSDEPRFQVVHTGAGPWSRGTVLTRKQIDEFAQPHRLNTQWFLDAGAVVPYQPPVDPKDSVE